MRFKDVFSIIGPSMIGPSSSHTAGAARLGRTARQAMGGLPQEADIILYGSFADTYRGHGTDLAIVAGLLDYDTDDERIRDALDLAAAAGLLVRFKEGRKPDVHPNTATITMRLGDTNVSVTGRSIGGGNVEIVGIDRFDVKFTANYPTLLIYHEDRYGMVSEVTEILKNAHVNISYMEVDREARNGEALTVIESDQRIREEVIERIRELTNVRRVSVIDLASKGGTP
ncbi:L-serine ammonia-lyase, iron-sulfur-dependent subunit beta [Cohnella abietis]|uniref:L-serine deaminase n=1 Tax=Cohnella abietis TaxID=2507935 RepID=A0A3T1DDP3_9BACL|nr:L-serine ammonia-lyase, iron-sulfur-dependent subunit beta [Cohnella abietis]BBI36286.1 putative L-serine dehydratase, beta chain [Cohnella abietis]